MVILSFTILASIFNRKNPSQFHLKIMKFQKTINLINKGIKRGLINESSSLNRKYWKRCRIPNE